MTTLTLLDIPMLTATNTPTEPAAMAGEGEPGGDLALLGGLMQLVSPALPIGAFAWSQGLESAFELGWVNNEAELAQWIEGVLDDGLSRCELPPLLARLQTAWANDDGATIAHWNQWLHATRETAELSDEDTRLGGALKTLLGNLNLLPQQTLIPAEPGYITLFAWAARYAGCRCGKPCWALPGPGWKTSWRWPAKPCPPWATPPPNGLSNNCARPWCSPPTRRWHGKTTNSGPSCRASRSAVPCMKPSIHGFSEAE